MDRKSLIQITPKKLLIVFIIAMVLRAVVAIWMPNDVVWDDGHRYVRVAMNILEGKGFGRIIDNQQSVPTQPIIIASIFFLFGKSYLILRLFFALLGSVICILAYILIKNVFDSQVGLISAILTAVYPHYIYLSALFEYPQSLFIFFMCVFFIELNKFESTTSKLNLFLSGTFLGLAILSVPTVLVYAPFIALMTFFKKLKDSLIYFLIFCTGIVIPVGLWSLRNYIEYNRFMMVNMASGLVFYTANNETYYEYGKDGTVPPCGEGFENTKYCVEMRKIWKDLEEQKLNEVDAIFEYNRLNMEKAIQFIRDYPDKFIIIVFRKFIKFWSPLSDAVHKGSVYGGSARDIISVSTYLPILFLSIYGMLISYRFWRRLIPFYFYIFEMTAVYCFFLPNMRYRLPIDFVLIMFSSVGIKKLLCKEYLCLD